MTKIPEEKHAFERGKHPVPQYFTHFIRHEEPPLPGSGCKTEKDTAQALRSSHLIEETVNNQFGRGASRQSGLSV